MTTKKRMAKNNRGETRSRKKEKERNRKERRKTEKIGLAHNLIFISVL